MTACPDETVFHDLIEGKLSNERECELRDHLTGCDRCRAHYARIRNADGVMELAWANERGLNEEKSHAGTSSAATEVPEDEGLLLRFVADPSEATWNALQPAARLRAITVQGDVGRHAIRLATLDIVGIIAGEGISPKHGRGIRIGPALQDAQERDAQERIVPLPARQASEEAKAAWGDNAGQPDSELEIGLAVLQFLRLLATLRPTRSLLEECVSDVAIRMKAAGSEPDAIDTVAGPIGNYFRNV